MTESTVARDDDAPSKRALLASALRLFVARGICETSIRDVAQDAGFSNPAMFKFFRTRDELASCVFERCYERLSTALFEATEIGSFDARIRATVHVAAWMIDDDRDAFLFVTERLREFWPRASPKLRARSIVRRLGDIFEVGLAEGKVSPDHDIRLLVAATIGTLSQFARSLYFGELRGPALRRAPELERILARIAW